MQHWKLERCVLQECSSGYIGQLMDVETHSFGAFERSESVLGQMCLCGKLFLIRLQSMMAQRAPIIGCVEMVHRRKLRRCPQESYESVEFVNPK